MMNEMRARVSGKQASAGPTVLEPPAKVAKPARKPKSDTKTKLPPQYKVLLHNDDVNHFDYVILRIVQLTPLSIEEAVQRTVEAHRTGVALLLITNLERAELYVEQFTSCGLTVTIEPAEA